MPTQPQAIAEDFTYTEGTFGLYANYDSSGISTGTTVFRYVQVADMPIPEASGLTLGLIAVGMITSRRRPS